MCVNSSYHPDDELIDVVWVAKLVDQRKQHTTREHLLKKTSQSVFSFTRNNLHYKRAVTHGPLRLCRLFRLLENNTHDWPAARAAACGRRLDRG